MKENSKILEVVYNKVFNPYEGAEDDVYLEDGKTEEEIIAEFESGASKGGEDNDPPSDDDGDKLSYSSIAKERGIELGDDFESKSEIEKAQFLLSNVKPEKQEIEEPFFKSYLEAKKEDENLTPQRFVQISNIENNIQKMEDKSFLKEYYKNKFKLTDEEVEKELEGKSKIALASEADKLKPEVIATYKERYKFLGQQESQKTSEQINSQNEMIKSNIEKYFEESVKDKYPLPIAKSDDKFKEKLVGFVTQTKRENGSYKAPLDDFLSDPAKLQKVLPLMVLESEGKLDGFLKEYEKSIKTGEFKKLKGEDNLEGIGGSGEIDIDSFAKSKS